MQEATLIDPHTLRAYRETDYRVLSDMPFIMHIDEVCSPLATVHAQYGVSCSAFITTCNPFSQTLDTQHNLRRQTELGWVLEEMGLPCLHGLGIHPAGTWPGEDSFLALGLELAPARATGRRFEQNAIVWAGADTVPQLILLR
jgi:hypothetical protein